MRLAKPNPQYNVAAPDSFAVRVATWQRRRMYTAFLQGTTACERDSILDVGVTSDRSYASSNYLEAWHPWKDRITAVGIDKAQKHYRRCLDLREIRVRERSRVAIR